MRDLRPSNDQMSPTIDHAGVIPIPDGAWEVDPERSDVGFATATMWGLGTVHGMFEACEGNLTVRVGAPTGELAVDAGSIDTGNGRRDRHLRSPDFFDVDRHPSIRFRLREITPSGQGVMISGELWIGDSATALELPVEVERSPDGALCLSGTTTISRSAAGLTWNRLGMIADDTAVHARITLVPAASAGPDARAA